MLSRCISGACALSWFLSVLIVVPAYVFRDSRKIGSDIVGSRPRSKYFTSIMSWFCMSHEYSQKFTWFAPDDEYALVNVELSNEKKLLIGVLLLPVPYNGNVLCRQF